jgi:hypothetical protein
MRGDEETAQGGEEGVEWRQGPAVPVGREIERLYGVGSTELGLVGAGEGTRER